MNGVMSASVSPGSSQRETSVTWTPMFRVPGSVVARAGELRVKRTVTRARASTRERTGISISLLEQAPELRDDRLRRPGDDLLVLDLLLERGAARVGATPDRVLDERRPVGRREVARRGGPDRMRQTGELALHPHELLRVLHRLFFGLGDVTALEIAAVLGA